MIRFIASDMDGTILKNGEQEVNQRTMSNVSRLADMGIIFAPASGRQYPTLRRQFGNKEKGFAYIAENGALAVYNGKTITKSPMDKDICKRIIEKIYSVQSCEILVSGELVSYMKPKTEAYLHRIRDVVGNKVVLIDKADDIKEDIIKISACDTSGIANSEKFLKAGFEGLVQMAVSGEMYLDFTAVGVNKGAAINTICGILGIGQEETISFGDNYNDIQMFNQTGRAFCMETAADEVKKHADYIISDVNDILENIIENKGELKI